MLDVKPNGRVYWPGMILGLISVLNYGLVRDLRGLAGGGPMDAGRMLSLLAGIPASVLGLVWMVAAVGLAASRAKCRATIVCCALEAIALCAQLVGLLVGAVAGGSPSLWLAFAASAFWSALLIGLYVSIARAVHDYAVSQGFMSRW